MIGDNSDQCERHTAVVVTRLRACVVMLTDGEQVVNNGSDDE